MRVEAVLRDPPLDQLTGLARRAESLGFDGLAIPELKRDPFILASIALGATSRIRVSTAVALAFPRSPTAVAYAARTLHDQSGGRFDLGLGTQVRGHIERRFSVPWSAPVARLREYIGVVRAVWQSWDTGVPPAFEGEHYRVSLMTPEFSPEPTAHGPIPIHIGAVNGQMLRLAAEACEGIRLHPFCTPRYLTEVALPNFRGAAERLPGNFEIVSGGFIVTGQDAETLREEREAARRHVAFYASTRGYVPVLALHGWEPLGGELRRLIAQRRWADLATLVSDEVLDEFVISGPYGTIAERVAEHLGGLVHTVTLPLPDDPTHDGALRSVIEGLQRVPSAP